MGARRVVTPVVCSIGCTDPWNAAGLGLDILALSECGARPVTVVTGVTAQDRQGLAALHAVPRGVVAAQFEALRDAGVRAYRVGALPDGAAAGAVAVQLARARVPVVYDPVLAASGGGRFAAAALVAGLLSAVTLLTPNLVEASELTGLPVDDVAGMEAAGSALRARGAAAVLVKGGHLGGAAVDVLVDEGGTVVFEASRLAGTLRGTGCLLACAAAAALARGEPTRDAVVYARAFVRAKFLAGRAAGGMRLAY